MTKADCWSMRTIPLFILLATIGAAADLPMPGQNWNGTLTRLKAQQDRGHWREAEQACDSALKDSRDSGAALLTVESLQLRCAWIRADLGLWAQAEVEIRQVVDRRKSRLGERARETFEAMQNLGSILVQQGRPGEAVEVLRPTIQILIETFGAGADVTIYTIVTYAAALRGLGEYSRAESILRQSLKALEGKGGPPKVGLPNVLSCLSTVLAAQGKFDESAAIGARALGLLHFLGAEGTPRHAAHLVLLGILEFRLRRIDDALVHLEQARGIYNGYLPPDHPTWRTVLFTLGYLYHRKGRLPEAEDTLRRALAMEEAAIGTADVSVILVANELAGVLKDEKKKKEARALQAKYGERRPATRLPPVVSLGDLKKGR